MSPSTYVNLMSDSGFKSVYLDRANKHLLIELINCILPENAHVKDIVSYDDRERDPDMVSGKRTFLDLVCVGDDGRTFSVEVQGAAEEGFFERCLFYACDIYRRELEPGKLYSELKPVYVIAITNYAMKHLDENQWDTDNFISSYGFTELRTGDFAPSTIFLNFAEVGRFTKTLEECTSDRDYLVYWFLNGWKYDKNTIPEELDAKSITKHLCQACEIATFTSEKRTLYNKAIMNERDIQAQKDYAVKEALAEGKAEGLAEGEAKGKAERDLEIARNMLAEGMNKVLICKITGLSEDALRNL
jgi:predicted transposase/invertase (TIGR01784 family)